MRIAFYSPQASHLKRGLKWGGDSVLLNTLFAELGRRGHEIQVISSLNVRQLWKGDVPTRSVFSEMIAVRRRVKEFRPDAWLVYNPSGSHPDIFGWWQRPKRYVLFSASRHRSRRMPRHWRALLEWSHRRSLRRADFVTAVRPPTFDRLLRHGVRPERLRLLPPAAEIWTPMPSQEEARTRLALPMEVPIVLSGTRFTSPNGGQRKTDMIIDLLTIVPSLPPEVIVLIAGDGPGRPRVEEEVGRLRLGGRVRLVGEVAHAEMKWFFAACDVYAYPYPLDIPFVSVLEAQGCGRPVVAMRTRSGELTVEAGRTGLLAATIEEFGAHLEALTGDRARCAAMGLAARQFITDHHSIGVRARQLEELLGGSPGSVQNTPADSRDSAERANSHALAWSARDRSDGR